MAEAPDLGMSGPGDPIQAHAGAGGPYLITVQGYELSGAVVGSRHHLHEGCFAGVELL